MTHIICRATFCLFWEEGVCSAEEIEYEPDTGCLTFQDVGDLELDEDDDEEEEFDWEDEAEDDLFDEDEDDWDDEEGDWEEDDF